MGDQIIGSKAAQGAAAELSDGPARAVALLRRPNAVKAVLVLPILCVALLASGCGGSGDSASSPSAATDSGSGTRPAKPSSAETDPTAAMQEFLDALQSKDAEGFCKLTEPDVQRENFKTAEVPAGLDCVESAAAMFAYKAPGGAEPFWEAIALATIGTAELNCKSADSCESAVVEVRDLPLKGGGTTQAQVPLTYRDGQWRIGPF